eukprot:6173849-Pleurochrysis_carterae.AAC.2
MVVARSNGRLSLFNRRTRTPAQNSGAARRRRQVTHSQPKDITSCQADMLRRVMTAVLVQVQREPCRADRARSEDAALGTSGRNGMNH